MWTLESLQFVGQLNINLILQKENSMNFSGEGEGSLVSSSTDKRKIARRKFLSGAAMTGAIATFGGFNPLLNAQPTALSHDDGEGRAASGDTVLGPLNPSQR